MTEEELIEALAEKEHESWARWMAYVLQCAECEFRRNGTTALVLPTGQVNHWRRQIRLDYDELSDEEKQYDRDEVAYIMPLIRLCGVTPAPQHASPLRQPRLAGDDGGYEAMANLDAGDGRATTLTVERRAAIEREVRRMLPGISDTEVEERICAYDHSIEGSFAQLHAALLAPRGNYGGQEESTSANLNTPQPCRDDSQ